MRQPTRPSRAFSLVELVMVVVILGTIGAIAIPRLSRAGEGSRKAALIQDLTVLNKAVDRYMAEHNGVVPTKGLQLIQFTDEAGNNSDTPGYPFIFGPYLYKIPPLPVGTNRGSTGITNNGQPGDTPGAGWWMDPDTGVVRANLPDDEVTSDGFQLNQAGAGGFTK